MTDPTEGSLPDERNWLFPEIDGKPTGWANLPPTEVVAIVSMVQYLTEQLAACHALQHSNPRQ
jgi:hypothetical protein